MWKYAGFHSGCRGTRDGCVQRLLSVMAAYTMVRSSRRSG